ncbi:XRE family transcriptional regulator [soil metagenome]
MKRTRAVRPKRSDESVEEQVGKVVRRLRELKGITLEQLAVETRLTKGQLSRIENGKVSSPVSTLTRIAAALGVGPGELFAEAGSSARCVLVKAAARKTVAGRGSKLGHTYELLAFGLPFGKDFEPYLMTIEEKKIDPDKNVFRHPGHEFLFLLQGKMSYRHRDETFAMEPGDSLFFDATHQHGPVAVADLPVRFLSVISNPPA